MHDPWDDPHRGDVLMVGPFTFELTCEACPEQYDVWLGERQQLVGYVRYRSGILRADHPECGGTVVLREQLGDYLDGSLDDRREWLPRIAHVLAEVVGVDGRSD